MSPQFVVQEHHATHFHYDLRLEIDDVLKSWVVPKGPSLSPGDKRLAIMVPDHPLVYASYEGIIPKGTYGAGEVITWDKGTDKLAEGDLDAGRLVFELKGKTLKGRYVLTRMKGRRDWLLIKGRDVHAIDGWVTRSHLTEARRRRLKILRPPCEAH